MITFYEKTALTGGGGTALDGIDGAALNDSDIAFVQNGGSFYEYLLVAASGAAANSPYVIAPATNPGTKRWILQSPYLYNISGYATGLSYQLTAGQAAITGAPSKTIDIPGTYLLMAQLQVDYVGATFAAVRNATFNIYRTNNTPGNVPNAQQAFKTAIITTQTYTAEILSIPPVLYTTANNNDVLTLYGGIDVIPSAGSIQVIAASLMAQRIR